MKCLLSANEAHQKYEGQKINEDENENQENPEPYDVESDDEKKNADNYEDVVKNEKQADIEIRQIEIFEKMAECLQIIKPEDVKINSDSKKESHQIIDLCLKFAQAIFLHIGLADDVCKIYEKMIELEPIKLRKHSIMMDYAQYALGNGRTEGSKVILQRSLKFACDPKIRSATMKKFSSLQYDIELANQKFGENYNPKNLVRDSPDLMKEICDYFGFEDLQFQTEKSF